MRRRRYLVAYDIRDPKRLRRVCKIMEGNGERMQYSVFICDLTRTELIHMRRDAEDQMKLSEDSIAIVDLGEVDESRFTFIGQRFQLPTGGSQII